MATRWQSSEQATAATLTPADFVYLQDGPRQGDTILAPGHTGRIVLGLAPNVPPRLGAELVYQPTTSKTAEGNRVYRLSVPGRVE